MNKVKAAVAEINWFYTDVEPDKVAKTGDDKWLSRNGGPTLCTTSFGPLPYLDPEGIQPRTDSTAEI